MQPPSLTAMFLAALCTVLVTTDAMAFYHPGQGRYLQRDPNGTAISPSRAGGNIAANSRGFIPRDEHNPVIQYRDGMNIYGAYHVMHGGVDPTGLERQVIALEGWGTSIGVSADWVAQRRWASVFPSDGSVVWKEFDWSQWRAAADYGIEIAKKQYPTGTANGPKTAAGGCKYDSIIVLGYSNGGDRVFDVVKRLKQENIKVDLAITVDPVPGVPCET